MLSNKRGTPGKIDTLLLTVTKGTQRSSHGYITSQGVGKVAIRNLAAFKGLGFGLFGISGSLSNIEFSLTKPWLSIRSIVGWCSSNFNPKALAIAV